MRKIVGKITIYIAIALSLSLALNALYMKRVEDPITVENDEQNLLKFESVPYGIEICNFGSSHGLFNYNYEAYASEYNCFNFALVAQSLEYDYRMLKYYSGHLSENAVVFVNISYSNVMGDTDYEEEGEEFAAKNQRYYRFLPPWLIMEYNLNQEMLNGRLQGFSAGMKKLTEVIRGDWQEDGNEDQKEMSFEERWCTHIDVDLVRQLELERTYSDHFANAYTEGGSIRWNEDELASLENILKYCEKKGFRAIMVISPLLVDYNDKVEAEHPGFHEEFDAKMQEVANQYSVEFYDYSQDDRIVDSYGLQMNSNHLNKDGAAVYTEILFDEVLGIKKE